MVNNNRNSFLNLTAGVSCSYSGFKDTGHFSAPVNVITFLFSPCFTWQKKKYANSTMKGLHSLQAMLHCRTVSGTPPLSPKKGPEEPMPME